jgi:predicted transcriptional regulator
MKNINLGNAVQTAFVLYEEYNMPVLEIANMLGVKTTTVRGYIYRERHPDKYKACVDRYLQKIKKPVKEKKAVASDKDQALKRVKELSKKKSAKKVIAKKHKTSKLHSIKFEIAKLLRKSGV